MQFEDPLPGLLDPGFDMDLPEAPDMGSPFSTELDASLGSFDSDVLSSVSFTPMAPFADMNSEQSDQDRSDQELSHSSGSVHSPRNSLQIDLADLPSLHVPSMHEIQVKQEPMFDDMDAPKQPTPKPKKAESKPEPKRRKGRKRAMKVESKELEELDSIDTSSLCKRERNKISASKYRKRRKMYIETMEKKVSDLEADVDKREEVINGLQAENKFMKDQVAFLQSLLKSHNIPFQKERPSTAKKAGVFMFVLFSCFLLSFSALSPQAGLNVSPQSGPGRALLSIHEEPAHSIPAQPILALQDITQALMGISASLQNMNLTDLSCNYDSLLAQQIVHTRTIRSS